MAFNQPNYYGNPYGNPYMQNNYGAMNYQASQYNTPQVQQPMVQAPTLPSQPMLYGKIVDNYNTADSQDVPIGMSGIYPKADGSAVYIKKWLDNGSTKTNEYKLVEQTYDELTNTSNIDLEEKFEGIYDLIDKLGKKIDKLTYPTATPTIPKKKKVVEEVEEDDE